MVTSKGLNLFLKSYYYKKSLQILAQVIQNGVSYEKDKRYLELEIFVTFN